VLIYGAWVAVFARDVTLDGRKLASTFLAHSFHAFVGNFAARRAETATSVVTAVHAIALRNARNLLVGFVDRQIGGVHGHIHDFCLAIIGINQQVDSKDVIVNRIKDVYLVSDDIQDFLGNILGSNREVGQFYCFPGVQRLNFFPGNILARPDLLRNRLPGSRLRKTPQQQQRSDKGGNLWFHTLPFLFVAEHVFRSV